MGSARDIVEECGVPRFLFVDFPLGNAAGKPFDRAMQQSLFGMALDVLEQARFPRTTVQAPVLWSEDHSWRAGYARVDGENAEKLRQLGEARRAKQREAAARGIKRQD